MAAQVTLDMSKDQPLQGGVTLDMSKSEPLEQDVPAMKPSHEQEFPHDLVDHEKMGMALVNSHMLSIPASAAYQNHDQIQEQFKKRGADMPKSTNSIGKDIEVGLQSTISGLLVRDKLPDELKDPTRSDKIISGLAQMVGDLPF